MTRFLKKVSTYTGAGPKLHISGEMKPIHKDTCFSLTSEISATVDSNVFDPIIRSELWGGGRGTAGKEGSHG